jgi:hypothetical protein
MISQRTKQLSHSPLPFLVILTITTLVMTRPLVAGAWDTIANYGDPLLNAWILAWDAHALITDPLNLFNANIFHPFLNTLAYSEHLLGIALPAAPLFWATGNAIFVHNLAVIGSFVLSGLGAYLLAGHLTRSRFAGLVAGLAYAFAGYRFSEISQLQNVTAQWLPFTFLFLARFFKTRARRDAVLFGVFGVLQILSNTYYAFYTAIAVGLYLLFQGLSRFFGKPFDRLRERRARWMQVGHVWQDWHALAVTLIAIATVFVIAFLPYLSAKSVVGERSLKDQDGANVQDYISVPETSWLARAIPVMRRDLADGKSYFPGFVALALSLVVVGMPRRVIAALRLPQALSLAENGQVQHPGREIVFYLGLALVGFVLSLGPALQLTPGGRVIFSPMPYTFLHQWMPGVSGMRVPARMAILVIFAMAILASYGAAYLARRGHRVLCGLLLCILIAEQFTVATPGRPIEVGADVSPIYRALSQLPAGVVLELPATTSPWFWQDVASLERLARQQYFSTYHWQPTIMGYSGYYPPLFAESIDRILHFPSAEALSFLRGLDVRYLVLHEAQFDPPAWTELSRRLPLFADQLSPMQSFGDDHLFALSGAGMPQRPVQMTLSLPLALRPGRQGVVYLAVTNPNPGVYPRLRQEKYALLYEWRGEGVTTGQGVQTGYLPLTHPEGQSSIPLPLPAPDTHGPAEVRLRLDAYGQVLIASSTVTLTENALPTGQRYAADLNFGNRLRLLQVTLDQATYRPGDGLALTLHWQKLAAGSTDELIFFSRLAKEPDLQESFGNDMTVGAPAEWRSGETVVTQRLQTLPSDLAPGLYWLRIGVYDGRSQQFVPVIADDGSEQPLIFQAEVTIR